MAQAERKKEGATVSELDGGNVFILREAEVSDEKGKQRTSTFTLKRNVRTSKRKKVLDILRKGH